MLKTDVGACPRCAQRFTARVDVSAGTGKCNCSFCWKMRLWSVETEAETFRLIAGVKNLADYMGRTDVAHRFFCKTCGIHAFGRVHTPSMLGHVYHNAAVTCLPRLDLDELMAAPVTYLDGLHGARWDDEVRHLSSGSAPAVLQTRGPLRQDAGQPSRHDRHGQHGACHRHQQ
jgi:hypothetical protein